MKPITHISQFSLLVCSFALALTGYFILPVEPPLWLGLLLLLLGPAVFYLGRRYQRPVTKRVAVFVIAASIGFVWAQGRAHMQARVSAPPEFGTPTISGTLLWHEATPRGSDDALLVLRRNGHRYELDRLARYHGVTPEAPAFPSVCRVWLKGVVRLAYLNRPIGLSQSCRNVDVVVMPFDEARYPCDALLFDKRAFQTRMHRQFSARKGKLMMDEISNGRLWQRD